MFSLVDDGGRVVGATGGWTSGFGYRMSVDIDVGGPRQTGDEPMEDFPYDENSARP